ncbi:unnamed protein product [Hermetia illucens]|uniref:Uncharacterized protein n=1 Tax=Hermetia illucens TaxID=343691 RepID=A0A7R8UT94_HERIL|nr:unnamed protein product [Hermetia illucens]CAD7086232.1 unnamed protein product [Hermetia illucens]
MDSRKFHPSKVYNPAPRAAASSPMNRPVAIKRTFDDTLDNKLQEYIARKVGSKKQKLCDTTNTHAMAIGSGSGKLGDRHKKIIFLEDPGKSKKVTRIPGKNLTKQLQDSRDLATPRQAVIDKISDPENRPPITKHTKKNTSKQNAVDAVPMRVPKVTRKVVPSKHSPGIKKGKSGVENRPSDISNRAEKQNEEFVDYPKEDKKVYVATKDTSGIHVKEGGVPSQSTKESLASPPSTTRKRRRRRRRRRKRSKGLPEQLVKDKLKFENLTTITPDPARKNMALIKGGLSQLSANKNGSKIVNVSPSDNTNEGMPKPFERGLDNSVPSKDSEFNSSVEINIQKDKRKSIQLESDKNVSKTKEGPGSNSKAKTKKTNLELCRKTPELTNSIEGNESLEITQQKSTRLKMHQPIKECGDQKSKPQKSAKGAKSKSGNNAKFVKKPVLQNMALEKQLTQIIEEKVSIEATSTTENNETNQKHKLSGLKGEEGNLRTNYSEAETNDKQSKQSGNARIEPENISKNNSGLGTLNHGRSNHDTDMLLPRRQSEWSSQMLLLPSKIVDELCKNCQSILEKVLLTKGLSCPEDKESNSGESEESSSGESEESNSGESEESNLKKKEDLHSSESGISTSSGDTDSNFSEDFDQLGNLLEQKFLHTIGEEESEENLEEKNLEDTNLEGMHQQTILAEDLYLSSTDDEG